MKPFRFRPFTLGLVLVLAVVIVLWAVLPRKLRWENSSKIVPGMTQAEVEKLLGGPSGHYGRNHGTAASSLDGGIGQPGGTHQKMWTDDSTCLVVWFDDNGIAQGHHKLAWYSRQPSTWDDVVRELKRRLRL
jgi:hypothetical protein